MTNIKALLLPFRKNSMASANTEVISIFLCSAYDLIYYHRHEISSMRFYSFRFIDLGDPEGNQDDTISPLYSSSAHSDFTSNPVPSGVGHLVLNQVPTTL